MAKASPGARHLVSLEPWLDGSLSIPSQKLTLHSMHHFCTYLDSNYLTRGLALYRSLVRHAAPFRLWVLCHDDVVYEALRGLDLVGLVPISSGEFEREDEQLVQAKANRSRIEYYFTCTPSLPLYILERHSEVDVITYVDADLYFFSDPRPIYAELGDNSVLILAHRFPSNLRHLERFGVYNVGLASFRRDTHGLQCLHWWRDRCVEWCYDRAERGRFADQKYLDDWPVRFPGVVVLQHKGAGLAPWNVGGYALQLSGGQVLVDGDRLVFFHFHGLQQVHRWLYDPHLKRYQVHADSLLRRHVYAPYIRELRDTHRWLSAQVEQPRTTAGSIREGFGPVYTGASSFGSMANRAKRVLAVASGILEGNILVAIAGRVV